MDANMSRSSAAAARMDRHPEEQCSCSHCRQKTDRKMTEPAAGKALGFWMCSALVVGNMIGSGVFLLPSALAPFGWNAVFVWLLTIAGAMALAFVFARLARALPEAGGPYAYSQAAFGPAVG